MFVNLMKFMHIELLNGLKKYMTVFSIFCKAVILDQPFIIFSIFLPYNINCTQKFKKILNIYE